MFGNVLNQNIFIDLSHLRVGTWVDSWVEVQNNTRVIAFRPLNSFSRKTVEIRDIPNETDNLLQIPRLIENTGKAGAFSNTYILLKGENGKSPFIDKYFSDSQISFVTNLAKKVRDMEDSLNIKRASIDHLQRTLDKDSTDRIEKKILKTQENTQNRDPRRPLEWREPSPVV